MSTETPPPPPPPPAEGDNSAPQAPKLKLAKPVGAPGFTPPPPPPPPAAGGAAPRPPMAPAPAAPAPAAPSPRVSPTTGAASNRNVGKVAAAFDVLALVASVAAAVFLYLELFSKTKG